MAAVVKVMLGLIISISIITALGIAVLENPQIQVWLEEQRRKVAELLRSIGEDLDPESRRQAEAFAFEGKTPATHDGLRREASGSRDAAALATGRTALAGSSSAVRRIPVRGPNDPDEAEERRRKGREYLAKRNQQMVELQEKRKAAKAAGTSTPPTPTSFDAIVDHDGKLREVESQDGKISMLDKELPFPPAIEPVPETIREEMREVERLLVQPMLAGESSSGMSGFRMGSMLADPFSDEFALDRSDTPKPPVPPKVELDRPAQNAPSMPGSFTLPPEANTPALSTNPEDELTFEEQLAIACDLSEAETSTNCATIRQRHPEEYEAELRAAIEASLKEMNDQQAADAIARAEPVTPRQMPSEPQTLVDLTPSSPRITATQREARRDWETAFEYQPLPARDALNVGSTGSEDDDELYRITPELTRARLATLEAQHETPPSATPIGAYEPSGGAVASQTLSLEPRAEMNASFSSAPSSASPPPPSSGHASRNVEVPAQSATTHDFESDSDSEAFASLSHSASEISGIEVVDVDEDSDVDMLSEAGNGVLTPDSWTEVGSRDGDSEAGDFEHHVPV
ncbi:hypothetical protein LTR15_002370 [Elasticomyces elasticus]|nr:hypothetical protein LTR15_002370 [Elasticomyces elasticus]